MSNDQAIRYIAEPTIEKFHTSEEFYRVLIGPVGSGKSTGCCFEIFTRAREQKRNRLGLRQSRWAVIRNTYRELKDTTLKTWLDWFGHPQFGREVNKQEMTHYLRFDDVEMEVMFRALDRPDDIKKVLSMELTGAWVNECREIPKGILDAIGDRTGRFPSMREGGCTWSGVIGDTNPPDEDHWIYRLAEEKRPKGWAFFRQPGGLIEQEGEFVDNPLAENISNLEKNYYLKRIGGKDNDYVRVYYCGQYGFVREGKAVHPEYVDAVHCAHDHIEPEPGRTIFVGIDFGLTPAAVFGQRLVDGRWQWIDEIVSEDMGTIRFATELKRKINHEYAAFWEKDLFEFWGDPSGDNRAQTDEQTPFKILKAAGIPAHRCNSNDSGLRREAMKAPLGRMIDGKPGFQISPRCRITRKGLAGGFCYKRVQIAGDERYHDMPDKNRYSHPCEAGEYMLLGAGEGKALTNRILPKKRRESKHATPRGGNSWMGV
jgi:hypothetical protein